MPLLMLDPPAIRRDDPWRLLEDGTAPPATGPVIVPFRQLEAIHVGPLGVRLEPTDDPHRLASRFSELELVMPRFAFPNDGRPYSQARMLRERLGFSGELRAAGPLVLDLVPQLVLAGFDAVELEELNERDLPVLEAILLPGAYAPGSGGTSIWQARHAGRRVDERAPAGSGGP